MPTSIRRAVSRAQVREQRTADAGPWLAGQDVRVADQVDVADGLDPHHAEQLAVRLVAPERDSGGDLAVELLGGHVRLVPAILRDHAAVGLGGRVDDREDRAALVVTAGPDGAHRANLATAPQRRHRPYAATALAPSPASTRQSASTTAGSSCVPALRRSSSSAS